MAHAAEHEYTTTGLNHRKLLMWAFFDATYVGTDRFACEGEIGACWVFLDQRQQDGPVDALVDVLVGTGAVW